MNENNKDWLLNEFPKYRGRLLKGEVLKAYYDAERILLNLPEIKKRGCGCHYGSMAREVDRLYDQWLSNENEK
jgi:hypothetical protein